MYEEELRLHQIDNLDEILSEVKNKLGTNADTAGHWCFKRKEGFNYLAAILDNYSFIFT